MATVRLSDAVIPAVYDSYQSLNDPQVTNIYESGIIARSELLDAIARSGGKTGTIPAWLDLDASIEENQSNDDPTDFATPNKLGSTSMQYRKAWVNQSWSAMDLVSELAGSNPMQRIRNRFGTYWLRRDQARLLSIVRGILADNIANDGGDMVVNIGGNAGDAGLWNAEAAIDAEFTMGDQAGAFSTILTHSQVVARMEKADLIDTIPDSQGRPVRYYRGKRVVMDDNAPKTGTGANTVYTSIFFGSGAVGFGGVAGHAFAIGEGIPLNPSWVAREEQAGNGGGMEEIGERRTILMHPFGFSWIEGTLTEFSPTNADLAAAAHWNRVVPRKNVPMAFLQSKA
ncbi:coat protein [Xanthomonas phage XAJ2]|uniref:Coat protein n=1 Tax=Xanthomonas phage XAJ2 TaxID=1775249 RepID=A0A1I9L2E0_9CAUD|nr:coat protein [Xanthomonas phage XAJ2]